MAKKNKKFKVVMSDEVKQKISGLSKKDIKIIDKGIKKLLTSYNKGEEPKGTMSIFGQPTPKELINWSETKPEKIDLVLEYLGDKELLNNKGKKFATKFWQEYIKVKRIIW